jgi:hypothetical protein
MSKGKEEVAPKRLDISSLEEMVEELAYNRGTLRNSEYPYHGSISQLPRVDPKYQVRLYISSSSLNLARITYPVQQV